MGRGRAQRRTLAEVLRGLSGMRMDREFAEAVARTHEASGPGAALVQLYAGGWEAVATWDGPGERRVSIERCLDMKDGG